MTLPLSAAAQAQRQRILFNANVHAAADTCNVMLSPMWEDFNDRGDGVATSLLARAMVARGLIEVAALWFADVGKVPTPVAYEVIYDLIRNPPPELVPVSTKNGEVE